MKNKILYKHISKIKLTPTSHGVGQKKILATSGQCNSKLMQVAMGFLKVGAQIEQHIHPTMEEFYYFENGNVIFTIDGYSFYCISETFFKVPANTFYSMKIVDKTLYGTWVFTL